MTRIREDLLAQVITAGKEYTCLLLRMEELTDRLMEAIRRPEVTGLEKILEARKELCEEIGRSSDGLRRVIPKLGDIPDRPVAEEETAWQSFRIALDEMQSLRSSLLEKQSECEELLAERLRECRESLSALHRQRNLQTAYREAAPERSPRFLDGRR